jgi:hypothetical protein
MRDVLLRHLHEQEQGAQGEALASVADVRGGDTIYTMMSTARRNCSRFVTRGRAKRRLC